VQVVVASVQTARRRGLQLAASRFDVVVVDEAHHATAVTYRGVLDQVGLGQLLSSSSEEGSDAEQGPGEEGHSRNSSSSSSSPSSSSSKEVAGYDPDASPLSSSSSDEDDEEAPDTPQDLASNLDQDLEAAGPSDGDLRIWLASGMLLLGFTATPYRMSGRQTRELKGMMAPTYQRDIAYMVKEGYLSKVGGGLIGEGGGGLLWV
jgi:hypothetical protein